MNGRPRNHRALVLSVQYIVPPDDDFDATDKALLSCLANNGGALGENCRPGNQALQSAAMLEWSATHERLNKNIRRGLIERTFTPHGRPNPRDPKTSIYQICYWHPAYPDFSPNGRERYTDGGDYPDNGKHPVTPDIKPENIRSTSEKHPVDSPKTSGEGTENIRPMDRSISESHPHPIHPPSNAGAGEEAFVQKPTAKGIDSLGQLPEEMQGATFGKRKGEVIRLIEEYGPHVITRAVHRWVDKRDMPVAGLNRMPKWCAFLDEGMPHIKAVVEAAAQKILDAKTQKAVEDRVAVEKKNLYDGVDSYVPEPSNDDIDEYLGRVDAAAEKEAAFRASPEYEERQNHFILQMSVLLNDFFPLPPVDWPDANDEERKLLQKAKAGDPHKLFLSREELKILGGLRDRYTQTRREENDDKDMMAPADLMDLD